MKQESLSCYSVTALKHFGALGRLHSPDPSWTLLGPVEFCGEVYYRQCLAPVLLMNNPLSPSHPIWSVCKHLGLLSVFKLNTYLGFDIVTPSSYLDHNPYAQDYWDLLDSLIITKNH